MVAEQVEITLQEPRLVAMDGEQGPERAHLSLTSDPGALRVLAPASLDLR